MFAKKSLYSILLIFVLLVAGCSSKEKTNSDSDSDSDSDGNIELVVWTFGSTGYEKFLDEYKKIKPNVTIRFQNADLADHHNNLFTAISAGSGAPDIAMIEAGYIDQYREAEDKFENLYNLGAKDIQSNYLDWTWANAESADKSFLFGIPTDIGPTVMYYRTDVFEEAGLPTDPDEVYALTSTWDDFRKVANEVKEKTGKPMTDNVNLIYYSIRDQSPETYFNREDELIIDNSPYIKNAYDYSIQLINDGVVGKISMWTPEWGTAMNDGSFAVMLAPSWMQNVIKGNAPDAAGKWSITHLPEGAGNWGGSYLGIPSQTKHADEAYAFVSWLLSPENQLKSFTEEGLFPSTPSVYSNPAFTNFSDEYFSGVNTAKLFSEAAEQVKSAYTGPGYAIANTEIGTALENVNTEGRDPEKEWKDALDRITRQLERR
jgi:cellobiose transport system substrate-binding protein